MRFLLVFLAACSAIPTPTGGTGDWDAAHADAAHSYVYSFTYDPDEHLLSDHCADHQANPVYRMDAVYVGDIAIGVTYTDPARSYREKAVAPDGVLQSRVHDEAGAGWVETVAYADDGALAGDVTRFDSGAPDRVTSYATIDLQTTRARTCVDGSCDVALFHGLPGEALAHWDTQTIDLGADGSDDREIDRTYGDQGALASETETDLVTGTTIYSEVTTRNDDLSLASWSRSEPDDAGGTRTFTINYTY
jgi:hypothetical protein